MKEITKALSWVLLFASFVFVVIWGLSYYGKSSNVSVSSVQLPQLNGEIYHGKLLENVVDWNRGDYFIIYVSPIVAGDEKMSIVNKNSFSDGKVPVIVPRWLWNISYGHTYCRQFLNGSKAFGNRQTMGQAMKGDIITYLRIKGLSDEGRPVSMLVPWQEKKK